MTNSLSYFRDMVTTDRRARELADDPRRVVGTFCNFVPEELILAVGAVSVRLCSGDADAATASETILPREVCSAVRATAGAVAGGAGLYGRADLLVMPTPCDGKKKLGSVLASIRPLHVLDLPPRKDSPGAKPFWRQQVGLLAERLEALTGHRLKRTALRAAIDLLNRRQAAYRRFLGLRAQGLVGGADGLMVAQASFVADPAEYTDQLNLLCDELAQLPTNGKTGPRLLLTGAPIIWPNHKVIDLIESAGGKVVADELCSGTQRLYQPTEIRENSLPELIGAVADKVLLPCTCPCFVDGTDRMNRLLELVDEHRVDGVVYHNQRLCALFDIESMAVGQALRDKRVPLLALQTDFSKEDVGQLRNRVDAFMEMIS
ncbi:MAG: 2-hydroxyacyl-CoA dehydratase [Armatimonadetes bacterium]|nr:2-hydroxyacyl-CoA dehydratase [Armatimonadota bacterium]